MAAVPAHALLASQLFFALFVVLVFVALVWMLVFLPIALGQFCRMQFFTGSRGDAAWKKVPV